MANKYAATPEVLGYKPGAVLLALTAGTTDGLENVQSVQGQPYSLMRAWQAATLGYVTLGVDASGSLLTAGGGGAGSTAVDVTLRASTAAIGSLIDSTSVIGHVVVDSMPAISVSGSTTVDANLSSAGSTRLVGQFTVANPTTAVSIANPTTAVTVSNPSTAVDATLSSAGSTRLVGQMTVANPTTAVSVSSGVVLGAGSSSNTLGGVAVVNPTTAVDATLSSAGSTRLVGQMTVANPTTAVSVSSGVVLGAGSSANTLGAVAVVNPTTSVTLTNPATAVTVSNPTTAVDLSSNGSTRVVGTVNVSSGVVLGAGSSGNTLGAVALLAGTTANSVGAVALVAGTTANTVGSVALVAGSSGNTIGNVSVSTGSISLNAGSTANAIGSVALLAGSSANTIGAAVQGPGSTANYWTFNSVPFSTAGVARTSVSTTVDISVIAANTSRKALVIANGSTTQIVALGLSTGAVTTALGNVSVYLQPTSQLHFGLGGDLPLYTGPIRGINITSTTVAGGVFVSEFT